MPDLQVQFFTCTNLPNPFHDLLPTAGVDEVAKLFQLHQVNLWIRFDHVDEIMGIYEFVRQWSVQTDHVGKFHC